MREIWIIAGRSGDQGFSLRPDLVTVQGCRGWMPVGFLSFFWRPGWVGWVILDLAASAVSRIWCLAPQVPDTAACNSCLTRRCLAPAAPEPLFLCVCGVLLLALRIRVACQRTTTL